MKSAEKTLKAFANRRRLAIVKYLKKGEATVGEIAEEINLSFKSTSRHLAVLMAADILEREQRGLQAYYRLSPPQDSVVRAIINSL
ncbi:MAG: metalloregulator ArsR/SmtB family transcription factor [Candidatus Jorgensenbacteria bacterium]